MIENEQVSDLAKKVEGMNEELRILRERQKALWQASNGRAPRQKPLTHSERALHRKGQRYLERKANARRDAIRMVRQIAYWQKKVDDHLPDCRQCSARKRSRVLSFGKHCDRIAPTVAKIKAAA